MANEGFEQIGTVLKRSSMGAHHVGEFVDIGNRKVRQGIRLEMDLSQKLIVGVKRLIADLDKAHTLVCSLVEEALDTPIRRVWCRFPLLGGTRW